MSEILITAEEAVETAYECTKCHELDHDHGCNPPAPHFLNCWNCGAGYGMPPQEMVGRRVGMFPKVAEITVN